MEDEKKPRKPDKRTEEVDYFDGFSWDILNDGYSHLPNTWINLVAVIQNLSELKVVLYILRHTWGFQEYDAPKRISVDEFVNGRKRKDGTRMDVGTGLVKRSVLNGIDLALEHGFISFVRLIVAFAKIIVADLELAKLIALPHKMSLHRTLSFFGSRERSNVLFLGLTTIYLSKNDRLCDTL